MFSQVFSTRFFKISLSLLVIASLLLLTKSDSLAFAKKKKGYLGVGIEEMTPSVRDDYELGDRFGIIVNNVVPNSPADDAGLLEDDVILQYEGTNVANASRFSKLVRKTEPGTNVKLLIWRDGKEQEIAVEIGKSRSRHHRMSWFGGDHNFDEDFNILHLGRPRLGVQVHELNADLASYFNVEAESGVLILKVIEESPAEASGLKAGDVITRVDDESVTHPDELIELLRDYDEGDVIALEFVRKGKKEKVEIELEGFDMDVRIGIGQGTPFIWRGRTRHTPKAPDVFIRKLRRHGDSI